MGAMMMTMTMTMRVSVAQVVAVFILAGSAIAAAASTVDASSSSSHTVVSERHVYGNVDVLKRDYVISSHLDSTSYSSEGEIDPPIVAIKFLNGGYISSTGFNQPVVGDGSLTNFRNMAWEMYVDTATNEDDEDYDRNIFYFRNVYDDCFLHETNDGQLYCKPLLSGSDFNSANSGIGGSGLRGSMIIVDTAKKFQFDNILHTGSPFWAYTLQFVVFESVVGEGNSYVEHDNEEFSDSSLTTTSTLDVTTAVEVHVFQGTKKVYSTAFPHEGG